MTMRLLRSLILIVVLGAAGWAYGWTAAVNLRACQPARQTDAWARAWRVGGPAWRELSAFADAIRETLPAGSVIAFRAVPAEYAVAWRIAYLLPRYEVRPVSESSDLAGADFAAVFRGDWQRPELQPVRDHRLGRLYQRLETAPP